MRLDFGSINEDRFNSGSVFFLYGNFKRSFDVFCDFTAEKLKKKFISAKLCVRCYSTTACIKAADNQYGLFGDSLNLFCVRGVEDNHFDKLSSFFSFANSIFILECGDYKKSKQKLTKKSERR